MSGDPCLLPPALLLVCLLELLMLACEIGGIEPYRLGNIALPNW